MGDWEYAALFSVVLVEDSEKVMPVGPRIGFRTGKQVVFPAMSMTTVVLMARGLRQVEDES